MMRLYRVAALNFALFACVGVFAQDTGIDNSTDQNVARSEGAKTVVPLPKQKAKSVNQASKTLGSVPLSNNGSPIVTLSATVKGNQEQPKVLYIVPWQVAQDHQILYRPLNSQTNRIFDHVERSEHRRELEFISNLGEKNEN